MKRLIILMLIIGGIAALCFGRYGARSFSRKTPRKVIQLAEPKLTGPLSFEEALAKRRSIRQFDSRPLSYAQIAQLAWAGQGITDAARGLRTAPSAGAIYPIDLYFATPEGLFVYRPREHSLEQTSSEDIRSALAAAASMQEFIARAPCDIVAAGSARKLTAQFRDKARTYMLLEAGHIAQSIQLQAVCLGLGSVTVGGMNSRDVARACKLPKHVEALYIISVGYPLTRPTPAGPEGQSTPQQGPLAAGKKAALIIPSRDFSDEELTGTNRALEAAGVQTVLVSSRPGPIRGMLGNVVEADVLLNALQIDDYDAIVFIGGPGVQEYFDSALAKNIARDAAGKRKVVAAISAAPTILANAGALLGRRATAFASEREKLQKAGAIFTTVPVEWDANIITCSGPAAAPLFGRAIAEALAARQYPVPPLAPPGPPQD